MRRQHRAGQARGVVQCKQARRVYRSESTTRRARIRTVRIAGVLVVSAAIAALGVRLLGSSSSTGTPSADAGRSEHRGARGAALQGTVWPSYGQAAVQLGQAQIQAGPNQHAAPIASVAKVMTAY